MTAFRPIPPAHGSFTWRFAVMNRRVVTGASLALAVLLGSALAADAPKSGPQPGDGMNIFEPLNVTGPYAGEKQCLV
jgi:hypothetical protein